ncbi:transglutaminase domain-containing protein [Altibacter sp. HG106]|uniref:transglutaminase domain-containing protein n=1 Tax=Altibacter sp. HG106 TaxID=3023937 RepID=UPI0023500A94|nr:transglutaminase domain-containing protein [Altibacter sp. HG106]MDC7995666.1 transglutaminase domain-containing protein [Altibacter sp. HG106]
MRILWVITAFFLWVPLWAQQSDFENIDFWRADYIATQQQGEGLHLLPILVHELTAALPTDVEKFRAIYYWVCHNIKGNYHLMRKNRNTLRALENDSLALASWNRTIQKEVFNTLRTSNETLCTGYAYLLKEMAALAGIRAVIIHGTGTWDQSSSRARNKSMHSWNAVQLNGKWYLCDATWSSGYIDMETRLFRFDYDDRFFLMDPETFRETHEPDDVVWQLIPITK